MNKILITTILWFCHSLVIAGLIQKKPIQNSDSTKQVVKIDTGYASFYGNLWHGRRTASGAPYHKDSMTCAHKTLPFGTVLRVTNLKNGLSVIVKVTDRGPHIKRRIIDLSGAAAKKINMIAAGIALVRIEQLR